MVRARRDTEEISLTTLWMIAFNQATWLSYYLSRLNLLWDSLINEGFGSTWSSVIASPAAVFTMPICLSLVSLISGVFYLIIYLTVVDAKRKATVLLSLVSTSFPLIITFVNIYLSLPLVDAQDSLNGQLPVDTAVYTKTTSQWVGIAANIISISTVASPLAQIGEVISSKDSSLLPFSFAVSNALSSSAWTLYAILVADYMLLFAPAVGLALSCLQVLLCIIYPNKSKAE